MTTTTSPTAARPDLRPVLWAAPLAGLLAGLVNTALFLVARGQFEGMTAQGQPFVAPAFLVASLVGAIGAGAVYALVARFAGHPNRVFTWIATAVLLLSFGNLTLVQGGGAGGRVVLALAHVIAYAFVLWLVPRRR